MSGTLRSFGLGEEAARLRGEKEWREGRRGKITLRKGGGPNVALLLMEAGDRLRGHSAPGPITSSVREGSVRCVTPDEALDEAVRRVDPGIVRR